MSMTPGSRVGPYEVVASIGVGGMGEVYRGRDTRLKRDVALKILPPQLALDPDRLARFQREAEVLASLNHPYIAHIHGLEDADGVRALVLELVEGPTLADRIARGPMPLEESLHVAGQIAEAVEAAHEHSIIHRDLKPANIKLRPDGTVKVLDFGLAKALDPAVNDDAQGSSNSPTITSPALTRQGVILGTAAYMSPEQAKGYVADKRSDIWAFGVVLREMLTGRQLFAEDTIAGTLAAVIREPIEWESLPPTTPPAIRDLLERCLDRDPKQRLRDIGEARVAIRRALSSPIDKTPSSAKRGSRNRFPVVPWAIAMALLAALGISLLRWSPWQAGSSATPLRFTAGLGSDVSLATYVDAAALSPDGRVLAFAAEQRPGGHSQLFIRRLDRLVATALTGTEGATMPFFSPDGQWVAFSVGGKLKKIPVGGGAAVTLCEVSMFRGGSWGDDGTIVFSGAGGTQLQRVTAEGGDRTSLTPVDSAELAQRWPQVLPGASAVLYSSNTSATDWDGASLVVRKLPDGPAKVVYRGGYHARYVPSGHLVYVHKGTLFALPFDLNRVEATGPAVPIVEGVASNRATGGAQFAISASGTLVYLPGQSESNDAPVEWITRDGRTSTLRAALVNWSHPRFSPDGRQLAMQIYDRGQWDVWVYAIGRNIMTRLTFSTAWDSSPVWSPDGTRIAYRSESEDRKSFYINVQNADGSGEIKRLAESDGQLMVGSWHPDGNSLAFHRTTQKSGDDLMLVDVSGNVAPSQAARTFHGTPASESNPAFSPDGRWIAYQSDESGSSEIYVQPFPKGGGRWQISAGGGAVPTWSRKRQQLFYSTSDQRLMFIDYSAEGASFRAGRPQAWSDLQIVARPTARAYDLHPDGERIAAARVPDRSSARFDKLVFVLNFLDELRRVAPGGAR